VNLIAKEVIKFFCREKSIKEAKMLTVANTVVPSHLIKMADTLI